MRFRPDNREDVYFLIDEERDYQNAKWKDKYDDAHWCVNDWVTFIERYVFQARHYTGHQKEQMDAVRKIAALAVAAMENIPTESRYGNKK